MGAKPILCLLCYYLINISLVSVKSIEVTDFITSNILFDGELETRIHFKGVSAKETSVAKGFRNGIKFRQLTDGKRFIQLIYDDKEVIRDCEYVIDRDQVRTFLFNFKNELRDLISTSNITIESLDNKTLPDYVSGWFNYIKLKDLCKKNHHTLKEALQLKKDRHNTTLLDNERKSLDRQKRSLFILPGTIWCGKSDAASRYTDLGNLAYTDRCCRKHDNCKQNIGPFSKKFSYFNSGPFTISHCFCDARHKRDLSDLLRVPGTKWCGKGFSATKFTQLGGFSRTDKCCRNHDTSCPFWIGGFETKYELFNWRVNTLMHCACDERTCLKMVGTSDSNVVGKIFFDIVQTKCFVLKPKKVCRRHSWWGKCLKYKHIKQAILRDNPGYNRNRKRSLIM